MITNTKVKGKKGERDLQDMKIMLWQISGYHTYWLCFGQFCKFFGLTRQGIMLWNLFSTCTIVSISAEFWFTNAPKWFLRTFYSWQLYCWRGGYFENTRQCPKLNKQSISIIVIKYSSEKGMKISLVAGIFYCFSQEKHTIRNVMVDFVLILTP